MKTILFILPFFPYPLSTGGHQAIFNGIRAVADDYNVIMTYCADDTPEYRVAEQMFLKRLPGATLLPVLHKKEELKFVQKVYLKVKSIAKKMFGISQVETALPYYNRWRNEIAPIDEGLAYRIVEIFQNYPIDIVQAEMINMASAIFLVPSNVRSIFVHHELAYVRHSLEMEQYGADAKAKAMFEYTKMIEIDMLNRYDTIITLSDIDRIKLEEGGVKSKIATSFAVVDTNTFCPRVETKKVLTFIGGDVHTPNLVGLEWFLNQCWGKLKSIDNGYTLQIISRWSERNRNRITANFPDVSFLGFVDDLDSVLDGATMIVPITIGSGIRMKILESASRGVPFVSTVVGAEGLPFTDGVDCFIKDDPSDFVKAIVDIQDSSLRSTFIANSNKIVSEKYSLESFIENRIQVYQ